MTKQVKNGITYDAEYWPECGTTVPAIPADLTTLWETHEDQASIFVAEALINEQPGAHFRPQDSAIEIFLWSVGGDILSYSVDLKKEIEHGVSDFLDIRSEAQADEASECVQGLQALEETIRRVKSDLEHKLTHFHKSQG